MRHGDVTIRTAVPAATAAALLHANRRTCCVCHAPRQPIEIHHIDANPSNHRPTNLAVLCRNCHGLVSTTGPLGRKFSVSEVRIAKTDWEERCADGYGPEEPIVQSHEVLSVRAEEHRQWSIRLTEGDVLVVGLDADRPVTLRLARESDYRRWTRDVDDDHCDELRADVYECEASFEADADSAYAVWVENDDEVDATITIDFAVWPDDDES